jgi:hypothetical protein
MSKEFYLSGRMNKSQAEASGEKGLGAQAIIAWMQLESAERKDE